VLGLNERAAARAAELDAELERTGELSGPLHGIPILVKDCVETSDIPTTFGSEALIGYLPKRDAVTVGKLRDGGAVILGKTTLPDFATSWFSYCSLSEETKNPFDRARDRADRARAPARRSPPTSPPSASAPTAADRSGCPTRSAGSSASAARRGLCRAQARPTSSSSRTRSSR